MKRIIIDFFAISILCAVVFAAIAHFFPDLGSPGGAISTVIGSMIAGQLHGARTGEEVSSGFAWKVAAILTLISILLAILVLLVLRNVFDNPLTIGISVAQFLSVTAFAGILSLLAIRFTFRFGVKLGIKKPAK